MPDRTKPDRFKPGRTGRSPGAGNIVLWILQLLLSAEFFYSAYLAFTNAHAVQTFDAIGAGQWLRYATGILEAAGAVGLLIPALCGLAALGLAAVMVGAAATELFILPNGGPTTPLILLAACLIVAFFRRDRILAVLKGLRRS
ncbi:MAG: DoxX family protein [Kibdelosporangium sp.]